MPDPSDSDGISESTVDVGGEGTTTFVHEEGIVIVSLLHLTAVTKRKLNKSRAISRYIYRPLSLLILSKH